ncbi:Alpha/Beta hydrolase protein [Podospora didyma]|uniref:Alpha/Beta hydrolase protein n=1 Tax=Podospora didyma TaxID=330526 RepID=A0AAE0U8Z8_9PEZI|nr:Alpha/Beta hydrolase protein [Podospora didyma]
MSQSPRPTIVLVPGAWYPVATYDKVAALLQAQDYKTVQVSLPSSASGDRNASFPDDIHAVRSAIFDETSQGHDVVVVAHSYGGLPAHSVLDGFPTAEKDGHVIGYAMLASGFTQTGMSFLDGLGGTPPPTWRVDEETGFVVILAEPRELFFHDLPEEEGKYWVSQLGKQSVKSLVEGGDHAYAGWKDVPVWYLASTEDKALPVQAQRMFVQMAKDAGGDVTLREVESSHSMMLSKPKETADFIMEAAAAFVAYKAGSA